MISSIAAWQMPHAAPAAAVTAVLFIYSALLSLMINQSLDSAAALTTLQRHKAEDSIALIGPGPRTYTSTHQ